MRVIEYNADKDLSLSGLGFMNYYPYFPFNCKTLHVTFADVNELDEEFLRHYYKSGANCSLIGEFNDGFTLEPKKVIFSDPATIVLWKDGTKTVVKTQDGEKYDKEKGLAMCYTKKILGNRGRYYDELKKYLDE